LEVGSSANTKLRVSGLSKVLGGAARSGWQLLEQTEEEEQQPRRRSRRGGSGCVVGMGSRALVLLGLALLLLLQAGALSPPPPPPPPRLQLTGRRVALPDWPDTVTPQPIRQDKEERVARVLVRKGEFVGGRQLSDQRVCQVLDEIGDAGSLFDF
jgi:hypothetical protein